jgi:hypothetical protein
LGLIPLVATPTVSPALLTAFTVLPIPFVTATTNPASPIASGLPLAILSTALFTDSLAVLMAS